MVDTDAIRWMLRNVKHAESPPDAVCLMELAGALVIGELPSMTQREWSQRWKCGRGKVRRIASKVADHYRTSNEHYRTTLTECFPHLTRANEPTPNTTGPIRARSFKEEEKEGEGQEHTPVQPWTSNSNAPIRTGGSPDSPAAIWSTCCEAAGFQFAPSLRRPHVLAMNKVRTKASPQVLRGAVTAYCAVVKAGTHPWQKDRVPSAGVFCTELPKWVGLAQGGGTLPRVREMVAGLEGLVKRHAYLTHAVEGEPEQVAEQFKGLLEKATGIDRTEVWAAMRAANAWQFGKWTEAARAAM